MFIRHAELAAYARTNKFGSYHRIGLPAPGQRSSEVADLDEGELELDLKDASVRNELDSSELYTTKT